MNDNFSFAQWRVHRVERFVYLAMAMPEQDRADYMRIQAKSLVEDALSFSRAGLQGDDLMPRWPP